MTHDNKTAVVRAQQFTDMVSKNTDISKVIDSARKSKALENRKRFIPIIKTLLLCGKLNISLRGHRDDGLLDVSTNRPSRDITENGNFRSLLLFRIDAGDSELQEHLATTKKKMLLTSVKQHKMTSYHVQVILLLTRSWRK